MDQGFIHIQIYSLEGRIFLMQLYLSRWLYCILKNLAYLDCLYCLLKVLASESHQISALLHVERFCYSRLIITIVSYLWLTHRNYLPFLVIHRHSRLRISRFVPLYIRQFRILSYTLSIHGSIR